MGSKEIEKLIPYLEGSCKSLNDATQELFELNEDCLTEDNLSQLEQEIFLCCECNWWHEVSDMSEIEDEQICNDCNEEI